MTIAVIVVYSYIGGESDGVTIVVMLVIVLFAMIILLREKWEEGIEM